MNFIRFLTFNFFTKAFLRQTCKLHIANRRIKTMISDYIFILAVFFPFFMVIMIASFFFTTNNLAEISSINITLSCSLVPFSAMIFVILNKDFFNGQSVSKRIYGYQIIDNKTNMAANETKCMLRNVTMIVWPIEVLMTLMNPTRRLGDLIAGTKLIDKEKTAPESIMTDFNLINKDKNYLGLILLSVLFTILFNSFALGLTFV
ncbi:RDD family protein, partial [Geofilum rubicundum]|uniref:RDD family protein n=1 Tax=Geofilum rubicundum TaxID=472113 RepID=UPI0007863C87